MATENLGISVTIEAELERFETNMREAGRLVEATTGEMDRSTKRAAQAFATLEGRLDPAAKAAARLERDSAKVQRALDKGAVSAERAAKVQRQLNDQYEQAVARLSAVDSAQDRTAAGAARLGQGVATASTGTNRFAGAAQNAAFQVGDFATQVASGQSAVVALAQQLPQFLGGAGLFGALAGAAVAVGGAIFLAFDEASDGVENLEEALRNANDEIESTRDAAITGAEGLRDLVEKYGALDEQVVSLTKNVAALNLVQAEGGLGDSLQSLAEDAQKIPLFLGLATNGSLEEIERRFQLTADEAVRLREQVEALGEADSFNDLRAGALELSETLSGVDRGTLEIGNRFTEFVGNTDKAVLAIRAYEQAQRRAAESQKLLARPIPELNALMRESGDNAGNAADETERYGLSLRFLSELVREANADLDAQRRAAELAAAEQAKLREEVARFEAEPLLNALEDIQRTLTDTFEDALKGNIRSFEDFADSILDIFARLGANLLSQQLVIPITTSVAGGLGISPQQLGVPQGAGGSGVGLPSFQDIGSLFTSGGSLGSTLVGGDVGRALGLQAGGGIPGIQPPAFTATGDTIAGALNRLGSFGGAAGSIGGNLLGNALFGGGRSDEQQLGATIGSTIGSVAGSFIPIPVVGPAIGSFLGNFIGGQFGPGLPSNATGFRINPQTGQALGQFDPDGEFTDKTLAEARELATNAAQAVTALQQATGSLIGFSSVLGDVSERNNPDVLRFSGRGDGSGDRADFVIGDEADDVAAAVLQTFLETAEDLKPEFRAAYERLLTPSEDVVARAENGVEALAAPDVDTDALNRLTAGIQASTEVTKALAALDAEGLSPLQATLDAALTPLKERRNLIEREGLATAEANQLIDRTRESIETGFVESLERANRAANELSFLDEINDGLAQFATQFESAEALSQGADAAAATIADTLRAGLEERLDGLDLDQIAALEDFLREADDGSRAYAEALAVVDAAQAEAAGSAEAAGAALGGAADALSALSAVDIAGLRVEFETVFGPAGIERQLAAAGLAGTALGAVFDDLSGDLAAGTPAARALGDEILALAETPEEARAALAILASEIEANASAADAASRAQEAQAEAARAAAAEERRLAEERRRAIDSLDLAIAERLEGAAAASELALVQGGLKGLLDELRAINQAGSIESAEAALSRFAEAARGLASADSISLAGRVGTSAFDRVIAELDRTTALEAENARLQKEAAEAQERAARIQEQVAQGLGTSDGAFGTVLSRNFERLAGLTAGAESFDLTGFIGREIGEAILRQAASVDFGQAFNRDAFLGSIGPGTGFDAVAAQLGRFGGAGGSTIGGASFREVFDRLTPLFSAIEGVAPGNIDSLRAAFETVRDVIDGGAVGDLGLEAQDFDVIFQALIARFQEAGEAVETVALATAQSLAQIRLANETLLGEAGFDTIATAAGTGPLTGILAPFAEDIRDATLRLADAQAVAADLSAAIEADGQVTEAEAEAFAAALSVLQGALAETTEAVEEQVRRIADLTGAERLQLEGRFAGIFGQQSLGDRLDAAGIGGVFGDLFATIAAPIEAGSEDARDYGQAILAANASVEDTTAALSILSSILVQAAADTGELADEVAALTTRQALALEGRFTRIFGPQALEDRLRAAGIEDAFGALFAGLPERIEEGSAEAAAFGRAILDAGESAEATEAALSILDSILADVAATAGETADALNALAIRGRFEGVFGEQSAADAARAAGLDTALVDLLAGVGDAILPQTAAARALGEEIEELTETEQARIAALAILSDVLGDNQRAADAAAREAARLAQEEERLAAQRRSALFADGQAILAGLEDALGEEIARRQEELAAATGAVIDARRREIDALSEQQSALARAADEILSTRDALINGASSPESPEARFERLLAEFDTVQAEARLGDVGALTRLPELARLLDDARLGFFGGATTDSVALFDRITEALDLAGGTASRQADNLADQIALQQEQIDILRGVDETLLTIAEAQQRLDEVLARPVEPLTDLQTRLDGLIAELAAARAEDRSASLLEDLIGRIEGLRASVEDQTDAETGAASRNAEALETLADQLRRQAAA